MTATLTVMALNKTYGSGALAVHAVRDVSFATQPGDFVAIVGPSGSGKTTLLAMIGGLLTPSSGSITVGDREITRLSAAERAAYRRDAVGFVFQANNLIPFLTARENLSCRAASVSASPSAAPSCVTRSWCWSTSLPLTWIRSRESASSVPSWRR
jgi:ABC-type lipoprotein export system ATPase subunit